MTYARTRSEPTLHETGIFTKTKTTPSGTTVFSTKETTLLHYSSVMNDVVTPNFKVLSSHGFIINNPMSRTKLHHTAGGGTYTATQDYNGFTYRYDASGGSLTAFQWSAYSPSQLTTTRLVSQNIVVDILDNSMRIAKLKAIANLSSAEYDFGEDIGEFVSGVASMVPKYKLLADKSKVFDKAVKNLILEGVPITEALSRAWATYRFLISPLIRSLDDAHSALNRLWPKEPTYSVETSTQTGRETFDQLIVTNISPDFRDEFEDQLELTYKIRAGIYYYKRTGLEGMDHLLGLAPRDLPYVTWQLIPYSFMVDRVVNISNSIQAITNLVDPRVDIVTGFVSVKFIQRDKLRYSKQVNPDWNVTVNGDTINSEVDSYDRNPWLPWLTDTVPVFTPGNLVSDFEKIADLLALIRLRLHIKTF